MPLPPQRPSVASADDCSICYEKLVVPDNEDPLSPSYIIDDIQLRCKHHFHMSCISEYAASSPTARSHCALCRTNVLDSEGDFMVRVRNENGWAGGFNMGNELDRQAHIIANPESVRAEYFLSLMSQREFEEAEKYLKGEDEQGDGRKLDANATYTSGGTTAMHMAALNDDAEGVGLLLRYGANKELRDEDGAIALDIAILVNAKTVMPLLL